MFGVPRITFVIYALALLLNFFHPITVNGTGKVGSKLNTVQKKFPVSFSSAIRLRHFSISIVHRSYTNWVVPISQKLGYSFISCQCVVLEMVTLGMMVIQRMISSNPVIASSPVISSSLVILLSTLTSSKMPSRSLEGWLG